MSQERQIVQVEPFAGIEVREIDEAAEDHEPWRDKDVEFPDEKEIVRPRSPWTERLREESATRLALLLLKLFGWTLILFLLLGVAVLTALSLSRETQQVVELTQEAFLPLVITVADVTQRIFGPLLGFVLGYYFGKKPSPAG